jgi:hypothetical protein
LSSLQNVLQDLNPAVYSIPFVPSELVHLIAAYAAPPGPATAASQPLTVVWADVSDRDRQNGCMEGLADLCTQVDAQIYRDEENEAKGLFADLLCLSSKVDAPTLLQLRKTDYAALTKETRITLLLRALTSARADRTADRTVNAILLPLLEAAADVSTAAPVIATAARVAARPQAARYFNDDSDLDDEEDTFEDHTSDGDEDEDDDDDVDIVALVRRVLLVSDERAELFLAGPAAMLTACMEAEHGGVL